jgi:hypothetical protein
VTTVDAEKPPQRRRTFHVDPLRNATGGRTYRDPAGNPAKLEGEPPVAKSNGWGDMSWTRFRGPHS